MKRSAEELGFQVLEIEDAQWLEGWHITSLLEDLRKTAVASGHAAFGTFHSIPEGE